MHSRSWNGVSCVTASCGGKSSGLRSMLESTVRFVLSIVGWFIHQTGSFTVVWVSEWLWKALWASLAKLVLEALGPGLGCDV